MKSLNTKIDFFHKFNHSKCVGFDLDNTLIHYNKQNFSKLLYDSFTKYLVKNKNYPQYLNDQSFQPERCVKGLVVDVPNGNLVKINSNLEIVKALHGNKFLNRKSLLKTYGSTPQLKDFSERISRWHGCISSYNEMAGGCCFSQMVELNEQMCGKFGTCEELFQDLFGAIVNNFENLSERGYFPTFCSNLSHYIYDNSEQLIQLLDYLKSANKKIFLLTNSPPLISEVTLTHLLGNNCNKYFDLVLNSARKPNFYIPKMCGPLLDAKTNKKTTLKMNGIYKFGNAHQLMKFFNVKSPKEIVYFGDSAISDIQDSKKNCNWTTVSIIEELDQQVTERGDQYPNSFEKRCENWGGYLYCNNSVSYWGEIFNKYSDYQTPSIIHFTKDLLKYSKNV
ncbi:5'-nucleotidase domain-containing protein [Anaeramoeba flamelloides]|uniref:5'-nucleotidase domain-containing protein n=1 Tax=Anaeramoeba flamelloides TaxID=1746091 RepID=A0ABQ8ZEV8_9EUKA|nr:5'-nucleotidase domain-containing protein [Anaeramoeba flamelloides]